MIWIQPAYMQFIISPDKVFVMSDTKVNLFVKKADGTIGVDANGKITGTPIGTE